MKKNLFPCVFFLFFVFVSSFGQEIEPDSAQLILKTSLNNARASKKNVLLIYHATWCKWCIRLDSVLLEEPAIKKILDEYYIITKLDIRERGEKIKTHENPGGFETLIKYDGEKSGIPFIVFLNGNGKMIANSNIMPENQNVGYPGADEEISAFIKLLKKTAPRMTKKQCAIISEHLKKNALK
jgi:thioredoxin-related protein